MKKIKITVLVLLVCLLPLSMVFSQVTAVQPERSTISLDEFYVVNKAICAADILQFMQVYEAPTTPLNYFMENSKATDEEIDTIFAYYLSFFNPEAAYRFPYKYYADRDLYFTDNDIQPEDKDYPLGEIFSNFTSLDQLNLIFPCGIVDGDIYDVFRTCSRQLCYYIAFTEDVSESPCYNFCTQTLEDYYIQLDATYNEAMEAEAAEKAAMIAEQAAIAAEEAIAAAEAPVAEETIAETDSNN